MHAQDGGVRRGADEEAGGDHHLVVGGLGIDVLDPVDALDDGLERLGDELDRVLGLQPVGADDDVDHRNRDLRLLLAGERDQRQDTEDEGGDQEEGSQRRGDRRAGEPAGDAEVRLAVLRAGVVAHGTTTSSPARSPVSTSTLSPTGSPMTTVRATCRAVFHHGHEVEPRAGGDGGGGDEQGLALADRELHRDRGH